MRYGNYLMILATILAAPLFSGCAQKPATAAKADPPATMEPSETAGISRLKLTEKAAQRLDIKTAAVVEGQVALKPVAKDETAADPKDATEPKKEETPAPAASHTAIPYAAVVYDGQGNTWTYTSPEPLLFVRKPIKVDRIEGDMAFLTEGPELGTQVVSVGAAELLGVEFKNGK